MMPTTKLITACYVFFVLLILFTIILPSCQPKDSSSAKKEEAKYLRDELSVQHGLELFNQHCATCHNFESNAIGPNLSGLTSELDKQWLASFIGNAPEMIKNGDQRAVELFDKYKQIMPPFTMLDEVEIEHILALMHKFSAGEKRNQNNRPGGILNPVSAKIQDAQLSLVLEEWITVPPTSEHPPVARINKMLSIKSNGGERLFIHDLRGQLYEIVEDKTKLFLDLAKFKDQLMHEQGWASGFGSFAFHPEYEKNGLFYTTHSDHKNTAPADFALNDSISTTLQWVLSEWKNDNPSSGTFTGTNRELLRIDMYSRAHGVQEITFNPLAVPDHPDFGLLYVGIGDGSLALRGYPYLCDNPGQIWSTVIRIDPLGTNGVNGNYGIPADNPFVNDANALDEVWAYGFRNAHRISWDLTGSEKMFITNIGQHSMEEVNLGVPGGNYGWPVREGTYTFDVNANPELVYPLPENDSGFVYPVAQYDHDEGNAVSGGFVYAGSKIPKLKGKYIFGDIPRGKLFFTHVDEMELGQQALVHQLNIQFNGQPTDLETVTSNIRVDLRLGLDGSGELYLFTKSNGKIYKVVDCVENTAS